MTTALTSYNEQNKNMIELVICNNDGMAQGAVTALNSVGFNTGSEKMIPVFGVDATDAAQELIRNKKMTGTIKQDADGMASAILETVNNGLNGRGLTENMSAYNIDENVMKVRIPYAVYLGENEMLMD